MGRHPGWGVPGGQVTSDEILSDMWQGGSQENVEVTERILSKVKSQNSEALVIVDPVMGDAGKLYVPVDVADAITRQLIPSADIITPNVWEFSHIVQSEFSDLNNIKAALLDYSGCALVTSVVDHGRIGALSYHPNGLTYIGHEFFSQVPNGGGDAVTGILAAHVLNGKSEEDAARRAVSSVFSIMKNAVATSAQEFPLTQFQDALIDAPLLGLDRLL